MTSRFQFRGYVAVLCAHALFLSLVTPGVAYGRSKGSLDWENVKRLSEGSSVIVTLFSGERYAGKVKGAVTDVQLPLTTKAASMSIQRRDIKTIMTVKPTLANPGLYVASGGLLLGSGGALASSLKQVSDLENGSLGTTAEKTGQHLEIAGIIVAAGGLAVYLLAGKPRMIYEGTPSQAGAVK